jgi:hypothetical protein
MPDPTPRQGGRPDQLLTNVALAYAQQMGDVFIADKVFPQVPVGASSAKYKVFPRSYFLRDEVGVRPLGGYPRQVGYRVSEDSYSAEEDALEAMIDDRERADNVPPDMIERSKTRLLVEQHLIHRDRKWADAFFKAGVWGTNLTGVPGAPAAGQFMQWDNDNSNPIELVDVQSFGVGSQVGGSYRPRTLVLGVDAYIALKNHPLIISRLGDNADRVLNTQSLAAFLGVDQVLVPQGIQNIGPERETLALTEAAANYRYIVGTKSALLVYSARVASTEAPSGGYIFAWSGLLGAQAANPMASVTRGRDDRAHSDWFHCRTAYDMKVVAPELGVFFADAVA